MHFIGEPVQVLTRDETGREDIRAGIITQVWNPTCVNVQVFPDSGTGGVITSVIHHGNPGPGNRFRPIDEIPNPALKDLPLA